MMKMKSNCLMTATIVLLFAFVLLSPTIVMAQVSPWSLFQQLCSIGRLATGPQCTGLLFPICKIIFLGFETLDQ